MKHNYKIVATLCALFAGVAFGHSDATGIVKERMDAMSTMGDQSKLVADMFKGKTPFEKVAVAAAADAYVEHGGQIVEFFPDTKASRSGHDTEALPAIWKNWDDFVAKSDAFVVDSKLLQTAIAEGSSESELKKIFFKTTKNCSSCHKKFRKPKDD